MNIKLKSIVRWNNMDVNRCPVVSVIVLTYNKFENIENNIKSIQEQDYEDIEIIIHDDCSTEFPMERIVKLLSFKETKYGYQIRQNENNCGTVKNYNRAIEIAKGEIIVPLAQDDRFCSNSSVREIVNHFVKTDCYVCLGNRIGENSGNRYPRDNEIKLIESGIDKNIILRIMIHNFISGSALYIMKEKFTTKWRPLFDERYLLLEDYPFVFRCLINHIHIDYINKDLIIYGEKGVSGSTDSISEKLLKDEVQFFRNEIVPALKLIRSGTVKKYIKYQGIKLEDKLSQCENKDEYNRKRELLFKNIDLVLIIMFMGLMDLLGYDRYDVLFKLEQRAEKKFLQNARHS